MKMRIGGDEVAAASGAEIHVINPATGEVLDRVPAGGREEIGAAVDAAEEALERWRSVSVRDRGKLLYKSAAAVRSDVSGLARILTEEQGKPLSEATDEIRGFANVLEFYASIAGALAGEAVHLGSTGDALVSREPIGICGAIVPWNMPALIMAWKVGPALLCGNTMVLKPASGTPRTNLLLAAILEKSGIPAGVLNVVTGHGEIAGMALVEHPRIRKVSFTGDAATGKAIRTAAAPHLKQVTLELGGSDPMIVWKDADLPKAVDGAMRGRFYNAGQICTAVKRLYLHDEIAGAFLDGLERKIAKLAVGNGLDAGTGMGPLQNQARLEAIEAMVAEVGEKEQGRIRVGGHRLTGPAFDRGFFYAPTLIDDVDPDAVLLRDEVFGPVLPAVTFGDLDEAISFANSTRYGLGASVWTRDLGVVRRVFSGVEAGIVWANRHLTVPPEVPFGGVRESGIGRENGIEALHEWTESKTLIITW